MRVSSQNNIQRGSRSIQVDIWQDDFDWSSVGRTRIGNGDMEPAATNVSRNMEPTTITTNTSLLEGGFNDETRAANLKLVRQGNFTSVVRCKQTAPAIAYVSTDVSPADETTPNGQVEADVFPVEDEDVFPVADVFPDDEAAPQTPDADAATLYTPEDEATPDGEATPDDEATVDNDEC